MAFAKNGELARQWAARSIELVVDEIGSNPKPAALHAQARSLYNELLRRRETVREGKFTKLSTLLTFARARALDGYHGESEVVLAHIPAERVTETMRALLTPELQEDLADYTARVLPPLREIRRTRIQRDRLRQRLEDVAGPDNGARDRVQNLAARMAELVVVVGDRAEELISELEEEMTLLPDERHLLHVKSVLGLFPKELERRVDLDMVALKRQGVSYGELGFIFYPQSPGWDEAKDAAKKRVLRTKGRLRQDAAERKNAMLARTAESQV